MATNEKTVKYGSVNGAWPPGSNEGRDIVPTGQEALAGAKRLYRVAMGKPWRGPMKLASGNRHTRIRSGVFYVNPNETWDPGWHGIVHSISHHAAWRLHGEGHGFRHAWIEKKLIDHVVEHDWLNGKLRKEPKPKADQRTVRYASVLRRLDSWKRSAKRAQTAIRKLERQRRYYERTA